MKIIRYILVIPVSFVGLALFYILTFVALGYILNMSTFWMIAMIVIFGGVLYGIANALAAGLGWLLSRLSPNALFSFWIIMIFSVILTIWILFRTWSNLEFFGDGGRAVFGAVLTTVVMVAITFSIILGSVDMIGRD